MSVIVSALVWQHSKATGSALLVALALADRSSDEGVSYPGIAWLAAKARLSERSVQYALGQLRELGELVVEFNEGPKGCNLYRVMVKRLRGANDAPPQFGARSGADSCTQYVSDPSSKKKEKEPPRKPVGFDFEAGNFLDLDGYRIGRLKEAFPAIDVEAQVARAALWLVAHPKNRKSNYLAFLNNWMSRAQDRAPAVSSPGAPSHASARQPTAADRRDAWTDEMFGARRAERDQPRREPPGLFDDQSAR